MKRIVLLFTCLFALQGLAKADNDKIITTKQLPPKAQEFIKEHFPKSAITLAKMEKDLLEKKYTVIFANEDKAEFDRNGSWEEIECAYSAVPDDIVPQPIKEYVGKHYPEAKIVKIERDSKSYEIKLNNKIELEFNKSFQLIDIDRD